MKLIHFSLLVLLAACGADDFPKVERLDDFRILAIEAADPEVTAGSWTTNVRLFVTDPKGGRALSGTYETCIDPGVSRGATPGCGHDPFKVVQNLNINTAALTPADTFNTGFAPAISVTVPSTILNGRSPRDQANGVGYLFLARLNVDGREVTAFRRIMATNRAQRNNNPLGSSILLNGSLISGRPLKGDVLMVSSSAAETYSYVNVDGSSETRVEQLSVAWYATGGEFNKPKSRVNEAVEVLEDTPSPVLLIGIVRDERGGVEVLRQPL
jgi:hypothetical protein